MDIKVKIIAGYELKTQFERIVYVNTGSTGTSIDDTVVVTDKTWSSQKINNELATKADVGHTHTISNVINLQTELDNKLNKFSTFTPDDIIIINADGTLKDSGKKLFDYALINHNHSLADITDISILTPTNNQILKYNSTTGKWENVDFTHTHTVGEITDFNSAVDNKISNHNTDTTAHSDIRNIINSKPDIDDTTSSTTTVYSSQKVEDKLATKSDITHTHTLDSLSNVDTTTKSDGQVLIWDTSNNIWKTATFTSGASIDDTTISTSKTWSSQKISNELSTKANATHTHSISDVSNLQTELDNKLNIFTTFTPNDIVIINTDGTLKDSGKKLSDYAPVNHTHSTAEITDFNAQVDSKISAHNTDTTAHSDIRSAVNSKPNIDDTTPSTSTVYSSQKVEDKLSTKSDVTHTHALNDLSDVDTTGATSGQALTYDTTSGLWIPSTISGGASIDDNVIATSSTWSSQKINSELSNKADVGHTHTFNDITDISLSNLSDKEILSFNVNTNKWENKQIEKTFSFPMFRVWLGYNANFTTNANSMTKVILNDLLIDTHNGWDATNHRYYIPAGFTGVWFIQFSCKVKACGCSSEFVPQIRKWDTAGNLERLTSQNGSLTAYDQYASGAAAIGIAQLVEGDYIEPWIWTTASLTITNNISTKETFMQAWYIRPAI